MVKIRGGEVTVTVHQPYAHRPHHRSQGVPRLARGASAGTLLPGRTEFPAGRVLLPRWEPALPPSEFPPIVQAGNMERAPSPLRDVERVARTDERTLVPAASRKDFRVRCTSKRAVMEMLELCGSFVQKLGDALPEEIREPVLRDAQWVRAS